ncbi:MAG TPA: GAF domain-containing sensor histidine kinase [Anaerolineae bacterium]|nr:GAF domain-containing sensor histidine kinase [Anaerolineae bacterium]HIQ04113.1 GAF domain-containing sensor histidine kinase [Anaerolineae bacterium]
MIKKQSNTEAAESTDRTMASGISRGVARPAGRGSLIERDKALIAAGVAKKRRLSDLEHLVTITQLLNSTLELEPLLQHIIRAAASLTHSEGSSILLLDENTGELRFRAATGKDPEKLQQLSVPLDRSIAGTIVRTGKPVIVHNAQADPRHYEGVDVSLGFTTGSILGVPLNVRDEVIGALEVVNKQGGVDFDAYDTWLLSTLATQAAIAIGNARLFDERERALRELQRLNELKTEFLVVASHELRTPVTIVLGFASLLAEQAGDELKTYVEPLLVGARRLRRIVEDIFALGRLESLSIDSRRRRVSLAELVQELGRDFSNLAAAKGQTLDVVIEDEALEVNCDRAEVELLLSHLLENAVKFTPEAGRIGLVVESQNDCILISVWDTAPVIPPDQREAIFERFYQLEQTLNREHGGLGIGLAIAKRLAKAQGGRIWVEPCHANGPDREPTGNCFRLLLPRGGVPR